MLVDSIERSSDRGENEMKVHKYCNQRGTIRKRDERITRSRVHRAVHRVRTRFDGLTRKKTLMLSLFDMLYSALGLPGPPCVWNFSVQRRNDARAHR